MKGEHLHLTVNLEMFEVSFSQNLANAKSRGKQLAKWQNRLMMQVNDFIFGNLLTWRCLLALNAKIKFSRKFHSVPGLIWYHLKAEF